MRSSDDSIIGHGVEKFSSGLGFGGAGLDTVTSACPSHERVMSTCRVEPTVDDICIYPWSLDIVAGSARRFDYR